MKRLLGQLRPHPFQQPARFAEQLLVLGGEGGGLRYGRIAIAVDHREDALGQIAVIIREVAIEPPDDRAVREITVIAERQFAQQEIAHRVEPVSVDERLWRDEVAEGF